MSKNFNSVMERLKKFWNITNDSELCRKLEIEPGSFSYMKRKKNLPAEAIIDALKGKGISLDYIFYGTHPLLPQAESTIIPIDNGVVKVKFFLNNLANIDSTWLHSCDGMYQIIPLNRHIFPFLSGENIEVFRHYGTCMESTISNGDLIFLDKSKKTPIHGKIFAVKFCDQFQIVQIFVTPEKLILKSKNDSFPEISLNTSEVEIIGQIIYCLKNIER